MLASAARAEDTPSPARIAAVEPTVTDEQLAPYVETGNSNVTGRLIANLPGDRIRTFDHWRIVAIPLIPYTYWLEREVASAWAGGRDVPTDANFNKLYKYARGTFTSDDGSFVFKNLSPGPWFAYAVVAVKDGRSYVGSTSTYEKTGQYVNGYGMPVGDIYDYVPHSYVGQYQCYTQGIVGDAFTVKPNETFAIPLALYGQKNDGC
jgi:hypothetical protein